MIPPQIARGFGLAAEADSALQVRALRNRIRRLEGVVRELYGLAETTARLTIEGYPPPEPIPAAGPSPD